MQRIILTIHGIGETSNQVVLEEMQIVLGSEEAVEVLTIAGRGVAPRHAWLWLRSADMQVESLSGVTIVNGHPIQERVQVEYPASVQIGEVTLEVGIQAIPSEVSAGETIPHGSTQGTGAMDVCDTGPRPDVVLHPTDTPNHGFARAVCDYDLARESARGGMGKIYLGEDSQLKRQVAIKVSSLSEGSVDLRFSKEAEVLALLAHPNIVPIHSMGIDAEGRPFYSMKLVKGRTLQNHPQRASRGRASDCERIFPRRTADSL